MTDYALAAAAADLDLDQLEEVAKAATGADWNFEPDRELYDDFIPPLIRTYVDNGGADYGWRTVTSAECASPADIEHITTFDPLTARMLLARLRQAEHQVRVLEGRLARAGSAAACPAPNSYA